jgi:2-dehydro-3-deoxygluconokinase
VFLSLITLQQMSDDARERAADWLATIRSQGATVAFSANHRAAGWPSPEQASAVAARFVAASDLVFASVADCRALFATRDARAAVDRLTRLGTAEIVVTAGADGAFLAAEGSDIRLGADTPTDAVDATGAGDAFAGTYLAWRSSGLPAEDAGRAAMRVASVTVASVGALPRSGSPEEAAIDRALAELLPPAG